MNNKNYKLEAAIVEEFGPRFAPDAKLIYTDALVFDKVAFAKLSTPVSDHDKFPNIILYDSKKKWFFLIEAATGHGSISPRRHIELKKLFSKCKAGKIYMTTFLDFATYQKHADDIAWETEVWIADTPSHMIHLNGDKFLGPR